MLNTLFWCEVGMGPDRKAGSWRAEAGSRKFSAENYPCKPTFRFLRLSPYNSMAKVKTATFL